ncbi:hypothetical protein R1flu_028604 [Riccia fluitans]|uniref:Uncharacterized protein n=1 Tax=Riccia fluitans TaxID=41844 RepID=A0ABD1XQ59_9MARC
MWDESSVDIQQLTCACFAVSLGSSDESRQMTRATPRLRRQQVREGGIERGKQRDRISTIGVGPHLHDAGANCSVDESERRQADQFVFSPAILAAYTSNSRFKAISTRGLSDSRRQSRRPWRTIGAMPMVQIEDSNWPGFEDSCSRTGGPGKGLSRWHFSLLGGVGSASLHSSMIPRLGGLS